MAIEYSLLIHGKVETRQIIENFLLSNDLDTKVILNEEGFIANMYDALGFEINTIYRGGYVELGSAIFEYQVNCGFRFDKHFDNLAAKENMIRVATSLLQQVDSDVLMLFNGEHLLLGRINNKLQIDNTWGFWDKLAYAQLLLGFDYSVIT